MFCSKCGKELSDNATACTQCGEPMIPRTPFDASDKEWLPTLLLCLLCGGFGLHSFYVGKVLIGILQLLTLGGLGIWVLYDLIMIITKNYRDCKGRLVVR